ncbi:MAG: hypothetical protein ACLFR7_06520 [Opitutales bacterium]
MSAFEHPPEPAGRMNPIGEVAANVRLECATGEEAVAAVEAVFRDLGLELREFDVASGDGPRTVYALQFHAPSGIAAANAVVALSGIGAVQSVDLTPAE